ncbi:hypothetical protein [Rhizocola hellebori]|nr:hypothetical protein [Rhizocola hellebori]
MSEGASEIDLPSPAGARTPAEFVHTMRALRSWAALTYGELEGKARANGDRLPQSTIASALARASLPREATIAAFVRACGGDPDVVQAWLAARKRVAAEQKAAGSLAHAVEAWLVARRKPLRDNGLSDGPGSPATPLYAQGRLAKLAAQSNSDRWRGVHRRTGSDLLGLRRLAGLRARRESHA